MNGLPALRVVPAGAGSGKTHTIQQTLGEWILAGKVSPERIVAVTYTEAAAAELRARISAELLENDRVEDALRLSQAYISTIHGFGLRILTEFAFSAGLSPRPRLLSEDEQNALIRQSLARTDSANAIVADLDAYGYHYDPVRKMKPEDLFRERCLKAVELWRTTGLRSQAEGEALTTDAFRRLADHYGPTRDADPLRQELRQRIADLLKRFPASIHQQFGTTRAAREDLIRDHRNLVTALSGPDLETNWKLWQALRAVRVSNQRTQLPDDYDRLAGKVRTAAEELRCHPGPLEDARKHLAALLTTGQHAIGSYQQAKAKAGLVDYTDMIATAEWLLRERPDILERLTEQVDCLVVDEFQDTNPLQFSLLWQLREAGIPTLVVGDLKQAIMGFQGADPRLFAALERNYDREARPLEQNWRSQARLMDIVNAVGPVLFGDEYHPLEPQRRDSPCDPLELVTFEETSRSQTHKVRAGFVALRLKEHLAGRTRIVDRDTGLERSLRGSDIAVLCRTHSVLAACAKALMECGLRVNYQAEGWLSSRAVQIAWNALAYLANPADRHAALYLGVTELGTLSLEQGLRQLMDNGRVEDPLLRKLDTLSEGVADRTVYALVADTLAAVGLFDEVARWPDGDQARANLLRLLGEAGAFMDSNREALTLSGYHGTGIQTFLAWLSARAEENDEHPPARVIDEDAIVLTTWHSAKGLEWPVVAVCGLDQAIRVRLPDLGLSYESFDDLAAILNRVRIDYWPKYTAQEQNFEAEYLQERTSLVEYRRLLYVALSRARDKLILEWPEYVADRKPNRRTGEATPNVWSILSERCSVDKETSEFDVDGQRFPCTVIEGGLKLPDEFHAEEDARAPALVPIGRRAIARRSAPAKLTPDSVAPSMLEGALDSLPDSLVLRAERYGEGVDAHVGLSGKDLGTYLHQCFEILGARPELVAQLESLTGVEAPAGETERIAAAVAGFEAWLGNAFEVESVQREWPLLCIDPAGSVVSGTADLIVRTAMGAWVLDHKSDRVESAVEAFRGYQAQLEAYRNALVSEGETVLGVGINWIRRGEVTWSLSPGQDG